MWILLGKLGGRGFKYTILIKLATGKAKEYYKKAALTSLIVKLSTANRHKWN